MWLLQTIQQHSPNPVYYRTFQPTLTPSLFPKMWFQFLKGVKPYRRVEFVGAG